MLTELNIQDIRRLRAKQKEIVWLAEKFNLLPNEVRMLVGEKLPRRQRNDTRVSDRCEGCGARVFLPCVLCGMNVGNH